MTIIGIIGKPTNDTKSLWTKPKITDDFRKIIIENGAVAIGILPTNIDYNESMTQHERQKFHKILNLCDGFILQGGGKREIMKYMLLNML